MFKKKKKLFDLKRPAHSAQQSPPVRDDHRYHPPRRMFGWRGGIQRRAARKQSLAVICLIAFLTLGAWGAVSAAANEPAPGNGWGIFSSIAELFGLAESEEETTPAEPAKAQPNPSMQLSKEYIYAGSRMLAIEDYNPTPTPTPPTPTPTPATPTPTPATPTPTPSTPTPTPVQKPDLVITNFALNPTTINAGDSVNFSVTVQNNGNAATPNEYISVTFLTNGNYNTYTGATSVLGIGQNVTYTGSFNPTNTVGAHTITAQIDDANRISELDENNNTANASVTVNPAPPPVPNIPANTYFQVVAQHSAKCADVSGVSYNDTAAIHQWGCGDANAANQLWKFERVGDEFQIIAQHSGKCMDVIGGQSATGDGIGIQQYTCLGAGQTNQLWRVIEVGSNQYQLVAKHSGKCLDVPYSSQSDGTTLQQYSCGNPAQTNQIWSLVTPPPAPEPTPTPCSPSGYDLEFCSYNGGYWDWDQCRCIGGLSKQKEQEAESNIGLWQMLSAFGLAW